MDRNIALAVGLYALKELTLGEAADYANISRQQFRQILSDSCVKPRVGPDTMDAAQREVNIAMRSDK